MEEERDALLSKQTEVLLEVRQRSGLKEMLLDRKMAVLSHSVDRKEAELVAALARAGGDTVPDRLWVRRRVARPQRVRSPLPLMLYLPGCRKRSRPRGTPSRCRGKTCGRKVPSAARSDTGHACCYFSVDTPFVLYFISHKNRKWSPKKSKVVHSCLQFRRLVFLVRPNMLTSS